jgi:hypothetical protein
MSTIQVANIYFESTGTNRIEYRSGVIKILSNVEMNVAGSVRTSGLYDSNNRLLLVKDANNVVVWGN